MPTPTGNLADMGKELAALSKLARRYDEITQQRQLANLAFDAVVRATPFNADHLKNIPKREEEFLYLAKEDPEEASLYFAIREIGWKFFATGALALMRGALDAIDDGCCIATIDATWCGIGNEAGGYWWS